MKRKPRKAPTAGETLDKVRAVLWAYYRQQGVSGQDCRIIVEAVFALQGWPKERQP